MAVLRYICSAVIFYFLFLNPSHCLNLKLFNASQFKDENQWQNAVATWYGEPGGAGSNGGACGYVDTVEKPPLSKMISAGGPSLFNGAKGCGACYEVKCTENAACSRKPVTVMITDECPNCTPQSVHFDLSGTAFGSLATSNNANNLRNVGRINIQYRRVACSFGNSIAFMVDPGANPYYFATEIEYVNGDGDIESVMLKQSNSDTWISMQRSWGARWSLNYGSQLQAPLSIKITVDNVSKKSIVAGNVIPRDWQPGKVYRSAFNF